MDPASIRVALPSALGTRVQGSSVVILPGVAAQKASLRLPHARVRLKEAFDDEAEADLERLEMVEVVLDGSMVLEPGPSMG